MFIIITEWRVAFQGWCVLPPPLQPAVRVLLSSFQPCPSVSAHTFWFNARLFPSLEL